MGLFRTRKITAVIRMDFTGKLILTHERLQKVAHKKITRKLKNAPELHEPLAEYLRNIVCARTGESLIGNYKAPLIRDILSGAALEQANRLSAAIERIPKEIEEIVGGKNIEFETRAYIVSQVIRALRLAVIQEQIVGKFQQGLGKQDYNRVMAVVDPEKVIYPINLSNSSMWDRLYPEGLNRKKEHYLDELTGNLTTADRLEIIRKMDNKTPQEYLNNLPTVILLFDILEKGRSFSDISQRTRLYAKFLEMNWGLDDLVTLWSRLRFIPAFILALCKLKIKISLHKEKTGQHYGVTSTKNVWEKVDTGGGPHGGKTFEWEKRQVNVMGWIPEYARYTVESVVLRPDWRAIFGFGRQYPEYLKPFAPF